MTYKKLLEAIEEDANDVSFRYKGLDIHIEPIANNSNRSYILTIGDQEKLYSSIISLLEDKVFNNKSIKDILDELTIYFY